MRITLANLKDATPQQVFDQVKDHLEKQGKQSLNSKGDCAYRGEGGTMCAAGILISEEEYTPNMEYNFWSNLVKEGRVPSHHKELIGALQDLHDDSSSDMGDGFRFIQYKINKGVYS